MASFSLFRSPINANVSSGTYYLQQLDKNSKGMDLWSHIASCVFSVQVIGSGVFSVSSFVLCRHTQQQSSWCQKFAPGRRVSEHVGMAVMRIGAPHSAQIPCAQELDAQHFRELAVAFAAGGFGPLPALQLVEDQSAAHACKRYCIIHEHIHY